MNILMMTNTYTPLVGGLERSIKDFTTAYRRHGHRVLIVAPTFKGMPRRETDVIRTPALTEFNGSEFSVKLPLPADVGRALADYRPDVVHAHHPFLMGNTAMRLSRTLRVPLVFTHHTLFEQYTHYLPADSPLMERFVIELATGFANLSDQVIAPSESVRQLITERGVTAPIEVIPTGVAVHRLASGGRRALRETLAIPEHAFVVGHVGRLAPEKNLGFLARSVAAWLSAQGQAWFLVVGQGPSEPEIRAALREAGVEPRLVMPGVLTGQALTDAYHAMDVFAFSSKSETQGIVVAEAMAAGVPVVAIDAPGVRDVVRDGDNGRLLPEERVEDVAAGLQWVLERTPEQRRQLARRARQTANDLSISRCAARALALYGRVIDRGAVERPDEETSAWAAVLRRVKAEWQLLKTVTKATATAIKDATIATDAADSTPHAAGARAPASPGSDEAPPVCS